MVRAGHAVAASSKWQARPQAKLFGRSHSVLSGPQSAIQFGATLDNWLGRIAHQVVRLAMDCTELQHAVSQAKNWDVNVRYTPSSRGLHLLIDSTGMKFLGEGEWKTKKHGAERRRPWRKVHIGIDKGNSQIRAIVVNANDVGDSPVVPELLKQIPVDEPITSFTGDGAYDTKTVYETCHERQALPIIPPRQRAQMRKGAAFAPRNEAIKACRRLGQSVWKEWSGYHRRSLVETKMNCIKKLGERVKAKTFERQVVEPNVRASILNRFTALGCPETVAVA